MISGPTKTDQLFKVEFDETSATGFKGLPQEFEHYLGVFTKDEIKQNPEAVLQSIQ